jgi:hypothetical protein
MKDDRRGELRAIQVHTSTGDPAVSARGDAFVWGALRCHLVKHGFEPDGDFASQFVAPGFAVVADQPLDRRLQLVRVDSDHLGSTPARLVGQRLDELPGRLRQSSRSLISPRSHRPAPYRTPRARDTTPPPFRSSVLGFTVPPSEGALTRRARGPVQGPFARADCSSAANKNTNPLTKPKKATAKTRPATGSAGITRPVPQRRPDQEPLLRHHHTAAPTTTTPPANAIRNDVPSMLSRQVTSS